LVIVSCHSAWLLDPLSGRPHWRRARTLAS
jgi:hypothetical protein